MEGNQDKDLKQIFDEFDLDKNGHISLSELGKVAERLGQTIPQD